LYTTEPKIDTQTEQELESGNFVYESKSDRQFHPLQFKPKYKKRRILGRFGYRYEFDIQTAAHSLLLQYAQQQGFSTATPALSAYISDRTELRNTLSTELNISKDLVKRILTGILQGATLSPWHTNKIFADLNYNRQLLELIRNNVWIQQYQTDVRNMWKHIKKTDNISERMTGRVKSKLYRLLESSVRKVIEKYLKKHKNQYFFEHDGWTSKEMPDVSELINEVKRQTGFVIELDATIYEHVESE
jgi:hypothetical protein